MCIMPDSYSDSDSGSESVSTSDSQSVHEYVRPVAPPGQAASPEQYQEVLFIPLLILVYTLM